MSRLDNAWADPGRKKIRPESITWRTRERWSVHLNEDGIMLSADSGRMNLEEAEVAELLAVLSAADDAKESGRVKAPESPTWEEISRQGERSRIDHMVKRLKDVLLKQAGFFDDEGVPF